MVRVMDVRDYASMTAMESRLSADIAGLKGDVAELRGDIAGLKHDVQLVDTKVDRIVDRVDQRMDQGSVRSSTTSTVAYSRWEPTGLSPPQPESVTSSQRLRGGQFARTPSAWSGGGYGSGYPAALRQPALSADRSAGGAWVVWGQRGGQPVDDADGADGHGDQPA